MTPSINTQVQTWHDFTRVIFSAHRGHATCQIEVHDHPIAYRSHIWLYALWVDKGYRGHGIAAALLDAAEKWAKDHGYKAIAMQWKAIDTPREVLDYYFRRGYTDYEFSRDECKLIKAL